MDDGLERSERTRVLFGPGRLAELGTLARELGAGRALLVSDPGVAAAGYVARAQDSLQRAGVASTPFTQVRENPTTVDVERCLEVARGVRPEVLVGLGGGSAIDTAKATALLLACGGRLQDYWGFGKTTAPLAPLIAVPTTAGTGSEVQSYTLIADEDTHQKMACGASDVAPRVALLDPELCLTLPRFVSVCTGLDAIGHAVETAVTRRRTTGSLAYSCAALRLAAGAFPAVLERPDDLEARGDMLRAATLAGLAIESSMLGAAHSLANPLTARCGLPHGLAVGLMLPHVVRFNALDESALEGYAGLARAGALCPETATSEQALQALLGALEGFLRASQVPVDLAAHGVAAERIPALAAEAARQWTAQFNPRAIDAEGFATLLERARAG